LRFAWALFDATLTDFRPMGLNASQLDADVSDRGKPDLRVMLINAHDPSPACLGWGYSREAKRWVAED
jgi:hypothetical protein